MISYCIACYRPRYAALLIEDLVNKTSVAYEILVWLNTNDAALWAFLRGKQQERVPLRVLGNATDNIGMAAYPALFAASQYPMVVQIDDDVVMISPEIAQIADSIFRKFPKVGMLASDVWQDDFTTGARPEMTRYQTFNEACGLYDGPIDGWFAVYRRSALHLVRTIPRTPYFPLGAFLKGQLRRCGIAGLLCTKMKVFHVIGPQYAHHFGMLDFEIAKYRALGRPDILRWYEEARGALPSAGDLASRVDRIRESMSLR